MESKNYPALALGTVQFGLPYGITNNTGQISEDDISQILLAALDDEQDRILDTAPSYGISEEVLGRLATNEKFQIVTKTDLTESELSASIQTSLKKLNRPSIYGFLDHNAHFLMGRDGRKAMADLQRVKAEGLALNIGASIQSTEEWEHISAFGKIDIIQIPMNVLDQRFLKSGHLAVMKAAGMEIHVRSAFLQGLLLIDPDALPKRMHPHRHHFHNFKLFCQRHHISLMQGALAFIKQQNEIDKIIVGTTSLKQWEEILEAYNAPLPLLDWNELATDDAILINPSLWPK